jgi:hypothetical protein
LTVLGFWLRFTDVARESVGGDETTAIRWTLGLLTRGYPSLVVDGRVRPALTSEILYYFKAVTVWLFGPNALGLRLHDVIFGTLSIPLFYGVGRQLYGRRAGILAAAIFAILPSAIGMTHYGRYPSQQLFFSLLTCGLLYRALDEGRVRPRLYYLGTVAFLATYLSWEGAAFYLPSLAVGAIVLTRPNLGWIKNPHVWAGVGVVATVVFIQLTARLITKLDWRGYGSGAQDVAPALAWLGAFYDPTFYLRQFFLLEGHHLLTLALVLGIPWWFGSSPADRALAFSGVTLVTGLFLMTNLLELHTWRYVYYLFPLYILNASAVVDRFVAFLVALGREAGRLAGATRWITRATGAALVGAVLLFSTTLGVKLYNLPWSYTASHVRLGRLYYPSLGEGVEYLRRHVRPEDVVVSTYPHVIGFLFGRVDYFLQFDLSRPVLLGQHSDSPIHRIASVPTILSERELQEVIGRSRRVWFIAGEASTPLASDVPDAVRRTMHLVYENWNCVIFVSDSSREF